MAELSISGCSVLVDDDDVEYISKYNWFLHKAELAKTGDFRFLANGRNAYGRKTILLHRYIMRCTCGDKKEVDHINHNTLDNRKCNLRITDHNMNMKNSKKYKSNTSGYIGVSYTFRKCKGDRWLPQIQCNKKSYTLGTYNTPEEAARVYDAAAYILHGEFACTNNLLTEDEITYFKEKGNSSNLKQILQDYFKGGSRSVR